MLLSVILRGIIIGTVASIPLGPVGVLCIQRTLSKSQRAGFVSGLGAAVADAIYSSVAFFSLAVVLSFIQQNMMLIKVIGGLCVVVVGMRIFMSNPVVQIRRNRAGRTNLWQDFLSVFAITMANPAFILMFITLFAAFGLSNDSLGVVQSSFMIAGVFAGSCLWWFALTGGVALLRKRFRPRHLLWINRISGAVITVLGAGVVLSVFLDVPIDIIT